MKRIYLILLCFLMFNVAPMSRAAAKAPVVFHEVDVQLTFWEAMNGNEKGQLAVSGSKDLVPNIKDIKHMAFESDGIKMVSSTDYHFQFEIDNKEYFKEFKMFKAHGMADREGAKEGSVRIPEVRDVFKGQVVIDHHGPREKDGEVKWTLLEVDLDKINDQIMDPKIEVIIRKNGLDSYDVFKNPRTAKIYERLAPKAVFVYGVATDFCVFAAVDGLLKESVKLKEKGGEGFEVYLIEDAIAGIIPDLIAEKMKLMEDDGAIFISTYEAIKKAQSIIKQSAAK